MTFKLNDKIRLIHSPYDHAIRSMPELANGKTGVVVGVADDGYIDVCMDSGYSLNEDDTWPFTENEIELITDYDFNDLKLEGI